MDIDTTRTVRLESSRSQQILAIVACLVGCPAGFLLGAVFSQIDPGSDREFMGWTLGIGCGALLILLLWDYFATEEPVLTLSPAGVRDRRVSSDSVPWTAVEKLSVWSYRGITVIVLEIPEKTWHTIALTWFKRSVRFANRAFGVDGFWITIDGLEVPSEDVRALIFAYVEAYGSKTG